MATKAKAETNGAAAFDNIASVSSETMKDNFEKASKSFSDAASFGKETFDAFVNSANVFTKSVEAINSETVNYSKQSIEDSVAAAKAAMTSRSLQELIEINSDYTKSAFDAYVGQVNKVSDMFVASAKDATQPLSERMSAFVEIFQAYRP